MNSARVFRTRIAPANQATARTRTLAHGRMSMYMYAAPQRSKTQGKDGLAPLAPSPYCTPRCRSCACRARLPAHWRSYQFGAHSTGGEPRHSTSLGYPPILTILQVTLIIDQTIDTIVTSSSPLAVSKATYQNPAVFCINIKQIKRIKVRPQKRQAASAQLPSGTSYAVFATLFYHGEAGLGG
jgi:hypothetical protein